MQICDISGIHCCVNYNTVLLDLEFLNVTQSKCSIEYCQHNHEVCFKASALILSFSRPALPSAGVKRAQQGEQKHNLTNLRKK